jgi:hypothetical protein
MELEGAKSLALTLINFVSDEDRGHVGNITQYGADMLWADFHEGVQEEHIPKGTKIRSIFETVSQLISCNALEVPQ